MRAPMSSHVDTLFEIDDIVEKLSATSGVAKPALTMQTVLNLDFSWRQHAA